MPTSSGFMVQTSRGTKGDFAAVGPVLGAGGLVNVDRNNDAPGFPWSDPNYFTAGSASDVALIESSQGAAGARFLVAVARFMGALVPFARNDKKQWQRLDAIASSGVSGQPALVETTIGRTPANPHGTLEVVAPLAAGGLGHWTGQYAADWLQQRQTTWSDPVTFGSGTYTAAAIFQSNYSVTRGGPGNLEVVALQGDKFQHFWRDANGQWKGPTATFGAGLTRSIAAIQSTFGTKGNFEVVAPLAAGGVQHFWRDNDHGPTWYAADKFAGGNVDAVALSQSNFVDAAAPNTTPHLEALLRNGSELHHWWRNTQAAPGWWSSTAAYVETPCQAGTGSNRLPFESGIVGIHMALLRTGRLVLFAFMDEDDSMGTSVVLDPATGDLTYPTTNLNAFCSGHVHLANGRVFVAGGHHMAADIQGIRLFDPLTESWVPLGQMARGRWYPTCVTLPDARVLVISGTAGNGGPIDLNSPPLYNINNTVAIFDPSTGAMAQMQNPSAGASTEQDVPVPFSSAEPGFAPVDLYPYCYVLPTGKVAVHSRRSTRLYDPVAQTWDSTQYATNYQHSRTYPGGGSSVLLPLSPDPSPAYQPRILVLGGGGGDQPNLDQNTPATDTAEILDLSVSAPAWRTLNNHMLHPRVMPDTVLLPDGKVLVAGGSASGRADQMLAPVYPLEIFDPATETFSAMCSIHVPRLYHSTAILLPDARVLTAGRSALFQESPYDYPEHRIEIFSPPYLSAGHRPVISSAPSAASYGETVSVASPDAASVDQVALIRTGAVTHGLNMDQRLIWLTHSLASGGNLNVTLPPYANVAPPSDYLLFLLSQGVPSVATFMALSPRATIGTFQTKAPLPLGRFEAQGIVADGKLYMISGFGTMNPITTVTRVDAYDPVADAWSSAPDLPVKLTHAGQALDGNTIYLAGGFEDDHPGPSTDKVRKLDVTQPAAGWSDGPSLPGKRGGGALVILDRVLHYFGGGRRDQGSASITQDYGDHWALDLTRANPTWEAKAPLDNPRNHMGGAAVGGKIYAIGGQHLSDEGQNQVDVDVYDPDTDEWSRAADLPQPLGHITANVQVLDGRIVVAAGITNTSYKLDSVIEYDPMSDSWSQRATLPGPRQSPVSGIISGQLIVSGGEDQGGSIQTETWSAPIS